MLIEVIKAIILGIVEGITEWLPISSTGHMILVDEFLHMNVSPEFMNLFLVVIQLGAIIAVVVLYFFRLCPFRIEEGKLVNDKAIWEMWFKVVVACIPAGIVGVLFDDLIDELFYNGICVSLALIVFGIAFIVVENKRRHQKIRVKKIADLTYRDAIIIGLFQLLAAIFPGTSRSGATIVGAMIIGISRVCAAEFTFFLAVPVMFGASALKILKYGFAFTGNELLLLGVGMVVAFAVSILAIRFLMDYIKKHDFKAFGWYRIFLGLVVLFYFLIFA